MIIDDDAVINREPGLLRQFAIGQDAGTDDDKVGRERVAIVNLDRCDARGAVKSLEPGRKQKPDAVFFMLLLIKR